ncbi:hypothetical protein [Paraburkholderia caffeinilytica]|uniref:Uncharacterized protein n=2 Tax=Paraburkholderia caffeinilytica TaxID=1761016 RepID=A0ABQ1N5D9_9BURK|nr:hypothetical protein [Paraburkholderia caffeinilytica]GGC54682.1 hypothetical protein GCM10011400_47960 [Paraburkholderia caffeinilytica]CAB3784947.1 hypothetical protein LMG28690_01895 [Paraburkholderia caffeinilytica]
MFVLAHLDRIRCVGSRGRLKLSAMLSLITGALLSPIFGSVGAPGPSTAALTHVRILRVSEDVVRRAAGPFLLKNPLLPGWVPLDRKERWLDPLDAKKRN